MVNVAVAACALLICAAQAAQARPPVGGPALPSLPGIGSADHRRLASLQAPPFRALARVQTELGARCSGFLIAPTLVMTAAHCLFLPKVGRFVQPSSVHVLLGYQAGAYRAHARVAAFRIAAGYRFAAEAATAGADRAVLVLEHPIGAPEDRLALAAPPTPGSTETVLLAGYGQDRDELAVLSPACAITAVLRDGEGRTLLAHDCQATSGTSGAPLVRQCRDGRWAAIGVQIEARLGGAGGLAAAALDPPPSGAIPADRCAGR